MKKEEVSEKQEGPGGPRELEQVAKELSQKEKELSLLKEKREKEAQESARIAKMLAKRNSELTFLREKRKKEIKELQEKGRDLEDSRRALMNILEDVEEARKGAEEEKNKTQAIINNFVDGLLFFDRNGILRILNPQAEAFFQLKSKDVLNKRISDLKNFPPLGLVAERLGPEIKKLFRQELKVKKDLIVEITSLPVTIEGKEKIGTLVILHDVTREKHIERMKTEFVSIAAHQLRTPLSAIKWTLRMLLDGDLGKLSKEQLDFLEKTYQSNERMIALINDLLNVTRIEEGRYIFKPFLVQFEKICQEVIDTFKEEIARRQINFGFLTPSEKLPLVRVDAEKIKLVVQNLLDNALKYTKPGGNVTVSLKKGIKEIEFEIKDTGVGIPKDQQKRIFTRFFRGANIMRMETTGTGLGLFIAKNIVEAHGGEIWFESGEGKGTTFYFTLPLP